MRIASFRQRLLGILALLAAALGMGGPATTQAADAYITPDPITSYIVTGAWSDTGVTLKADMPAGPAGYTTVNISDQSLLRTGWIVKVGSEKMLIEELNEGGVGHDDTMVVRRPWEGTAGTPHASGDKIWGHTKTVSIWAKNVTAQYGLGAFSVSLTFPPEVQYIKLKVNTQWLGSTGRPVDCFGPSEIAPNTWEVRCATWGGYEHLGPTGSGVIATATVLPPSSGMSTVSLADSFLADITGAIIPTNAPQNMNFRVIDCPDVDLSGKITVADAFQTALQWGDRGKDCGLKLSSDISSSETTLQINDQNLAWWSGPGCGAPGTNRPDTIAIDNEIMAVGQFTEAGSPDTVTVTRAANASVAKSHLAGSTISLTPSQWNGNADGVNGYTPRRDISDHDGKVYISDTWVVVQVLNMNCP